MPKPPKVDAKTAELDRSGTLNPHPEAIVDPLFQNNPFFDPRDLLQARYEMLRRHRIERRSIVETTQAFGVSRPTFYHAQTAFTEQGLVGLLPQLRGPKSRQIRPEIQDALSSGRACKIQPAMPKARFSVA